MWKKVSLVCLAAIMLVAMVACGGSKDSSSPTKGFDRAMNAMVNLDTAEMKASFVSQPDLSLDGMEQYTSLLKKVLKTIEWKVLDEKIDADGTTATLTVTMSMPDFSKALNGIQAEFTAWYTKNKDASPEKIMEKTIEMLLDKAGDYDKLSMTDTIDMLLVDGVWKLDENMDLDDFLDF